MKTLLGFATVLLATSLSLAAESKIVCQKTTSTGEIGRVEISEDEVVVTGGFLHKPHVFKNLTKVNGLITAPGLAITMDNHYGCLRNAVVITEFREPFGAGYMDVVHMGTCSGGSTPDALCKPGF